MTLTLDSQLLALYLGCGCQIVEIDTCTCTRNGSITMLTVRFDDQAEEDDYTVLNENANIDRIKPILRPLPSLTEEEVVKLVRLRSDIYLNVSLAEKVDHRWVWFEFEYKSSCRRRRQLLEFDELNPEQFRYLLSLHMDLFGLIDAGLALDITKVKR